jgi:MFS family permease
MHLPRRRVEHRVDYLGAAVIAIGATAIVLLTTWGGTQYAWGSWEILLLAGITAASIAAFFLVEGRAVEPVLPLHVFKNRNFSLASGMSFLLGFVMLGALTFLPLYQQTVQHASPTTSGLMLIPLMLGSTVTTLVAGQITTKTGRYKVLPVIGGVIMTIAIYLLTHLGPHTTRLTSALYFVVLGVGMGFLMQITSLIVQNSVEQKDMGVASSSRAFFQQIGGSMGVSLFGVIFIHRLASVMASQVPGAQVHAGLGSLDPATINSLPAVIKEAAFVGVSKGLDAVFWWTIPASALVFLLALWVKEIPLRGRNDGPVAQPAAPLEPLEAAADLGAI